MSYRAWEQFQDPDYDEVKKQIEGLENNPKGSAIVSLLAFPDEIPDPEHNAEAPRNVIHYTVVTACTPEGLMISDSQEFTTIVKKNDELFYGKTKVKLGYLFVMRGKQLDPS